MPASLTRIFDWIHHQAKLGFFLQVQQQTYTSNGTMDYRVAVKKVYAFRDLNALYPKSETVYIEHRNGSLVNTYTGQAVVVWVIAYIFEYSSSGIS